MSLITDMNAINDKRFLDKLLRDSGTLRLERHPVDMETMGLQKEKMMEMCLLGGYSYKLPEIVADTYEAIVLEKTIHIFERGFWFEEGVGFVSR